jgi:hypothetical protein
MNSIIAKSTALFEAWLAPLVNLEYTLLLFATFIFHHLYFGKAHVIADFCALDGSIPVVVYVYGSIVLLASLIRLPEDWQDFVTWLVFLGSAFISIAFNSLFYLRPTTPSWQELAAQLVYTLEGVLSLVLIIRSILQKETARYKVTPRLGTIPTSLKSLGILAYVVGMTVLLQHGGSLTPEAITARITLYGAVLLELFAHLSQHWDRDYPIV